MTPTIIILILIGLLLIAVSYVISEKYANEKFLDEIKQTGGYESFLSDRDLQDIKEKAIHVAREAVEGETDRTIAELASMTNEKIMAIGEYAEPVLEDISKAHQEVLFLYSMINEKEKEIKNSVANANQTQNILKKHVDIIKKIEKEAIENISKQSVRQREGSRSTKPIQTGPMENHTQHIENPPEYKFRSRVNKNIIDNEANHNKKILELHERGMELRDIAKTLGLGIGEVKLVIDLSVKR